MELRLTLDDEVARLAEQKALSVGITLEQAVWTYLWRFAEGTELLENELGPDGTFREQMYRF